jgi:hypothetical protein
VADLSEDDARTWLCGVLPQLRGLAARDGWADRLERIIDDIARGGSPAQACERLGFHRPAGGPRGPGNGLPSLAGLGIDGWPMRGEWACPHEQPCDLRTVAGRDGREPRCALYGGKMVLRPAPGGSAA